MRIRYNGMVLALVLCIQAGYGANEHMTTFDLRARDANVIIRPIRKDLSIKIGENESYLVNAQGILKAPNADKSNVQVDTIENDRFNISILGGLVNLSCETENDNGESDPLWKVILYNTKYDKKLAIQADYLNTLDVAAKNLVTSARKNWIQNYGYLVSDHLTELSKCIDLHCQHEGNYSTSSNKFKKKNAVKNSLKEIWRFNQNFYQQEFDERGNPKRLGFYCHKNAKINTNGYVRTVGLKSEVSGQVNVNRWISNKEVRFNVNPSSKNNNQPQIQINYLDAFHASVNAYVISRNEQDQWLIKNNDESVCFVVDQSVNPIVSMNYEKNFIEENIKSVYLDEDSTLAILSVVLKRVILNILKETHDDIEVHSVSDEWQKKTFGGVTLLKNESLVFENMNVIVRNISTSEGGKGNDYFFRSALLNYKGLVCGEELMRQIWNNSIRKLNSDKKNKVFLSLIEDGLPQGISVDECINCLKLDEACRLLAKYRNLWGDAKSSLAVAALEPTERLIRTGIMIILKDFLPIKELERKSLDEILRIDFQSGYFKSLVMCKLKSNSNQVEGASEDERQKLFLKSCNDISVNIFGGTDEEENSKGFDLSQHAGTFGGTFVNDLNKLLE